MEAIANETAQELLSTLKLPENFGYQPFIKLAETENRYLRDLKINLQNALKSDHLSAKETALIGYAIAVNNKNAALQDFFNALAMEQEASEAEIAEMAACASLLAANNVFYRFRHFMGKESYEHMPARIKMTIMMQPIVGKEFFELVSLAVSAVNGCEKCVTAHEHSVLQLGATEQRIFDAIRLTSVIASFDRIFN